MKRIAHELNVSTYHIELDIKRTYETRWLNPYYSLSPPWEEQPPKLRFLSSISSTIKQNLR